MFRGSLRLRKISGTASAPILYHQAADDRRTGEKALSKHPSGRRHGFQRRLGQNQRRRDSQSGILRIQVPPPTKRVGRRLPGRHKKSVHRSVPHSRCPGRITYPISCMARGLSGLPAFEQRKCPLKSRGHLRCLALGKAETMQAALITRRCILRF